MSEAVADHTEWANARENQHGSLPIAISQPFPAEDAHHSLVFLVLLGSFEHELWHDGC